MLKEEIYKLIDTIENILESNKIDMKNLKKKQKMINKLCNQPEYVDIERLVEEENKIISSIELLKDEQLKLKKVLYRQKVSLDILQNKVNNNQ